MKSTGFLGFFQRGSTVEEFFGVAFWKDTAHDRELAVVDLVILRVVKDSYRVSVTRKTWTLSLNGRTLTKYKRTIDMDGVTENTQVFQKQ